MSATQRDIRETDLFREAESLFKTFRQPGTGQISDAVEASVAPDGKYAVFSGVLMDKLEGGAQTRICRTDVASGDTRVLTFGPNTDRSPKYAPDGRQVAFLSDRHSRGDFQLHLLDPVTGVVRATPRVEGWVEYLQWSPDSKRVLLGVAGHGADVAGGQGAVSSKQRATELPSWMPSVETGDESYRWRRAWVYELASDRVRQVSGADTNVWEANWCGNGALAAIISPGPGEGLWYTAKVASIDLETGKSRELYTPKDQLGWPAASLSGKHLAVVESVCSDRWIVAGDLLVIETGKGAVKRVDTRGIDVTWTEWRSDGVLLFAGHRGFETVVARYDVGSGSVTDVWGSRDLTTGGRFITASGFGEGGDCVLVAENFTRAPELAVIRGGEYRTVRSFDVGYRGLSEVIGSVEAVTWKARDGLEIQGWVLRPKASGPRPLIMQVHGGPVWQSRQTCLGRSHVANLMLLRRGYAIFFPNPRGSCGQGQAFIRHVVGDMGGADAQDLLSGLDHLVARGIADPKKLGVTGGSYGGFMTSWLITQDPRFAAAVSVAPVTNQVTEHLISNIPHFVEMFVADKYTNLGGEYYKRSPVMFAHKVKTPTLNICGALDRCTPPEEAVQFHNALLENKVESVLATYPEEGHGVRNFPAAIDYVARVVGWFEEHIGGGVKEGKTV